MSLHTNMLSFIASWAIVSWCFLDSDQNMGLANYPKCHILDHSVIAEELKFQNRNVWLNHWMESPHFTPVTSISSNSICRWLLFWALCLDPAASHGNCSFLSCFETKKPIEFAGRYTAFSENQPYIENANLKVPDMLYWASYAVKGKYPPKCEWTLPFCLYLCPVLLLHLMYTRCFLEIV